MKCPQLCSRICKMPAMCTPHQFKCRQSPVRSKYALFSFASVIIICFSFTFFPHIWIIEHGLAGLRAHRLRKDTCVHAANSHSLEGNWKMFFACDARIHKMQSDRQYDYSKSSKANTSHDSNTWSFSITRVHTFIHTYKHVTSHCTSHYSNEIRLYWPPHTCHSQTQKKAAHVHGCNKELYASLTLRAFQAPSNEGFRAVILAPTRELAAQIHREFTRVAQVWNNETDQLAYVMFVFVFVCVRMRIRVRLCCARMVVINQLTCSLRIHAGAVVTHSHVCAFVCACGCFLRVCRARWCF